ncbi:TPA: hypothetical protein KKX77_002628 [Legionella pneumophila]|nr:hypothetical protein [Legionella pneumophila]HCU5995158.1 hypothetical protein [Legionella pneumophila]
MTKKSINVTGIMIDAEYKNFKLYSVEDSREVEHKPGTYCSQSGSGESRAEGFENILGYLSTVRDANTQYVIVYDISCLHKEDHIKKLLEGIKKTKKNDLLPILISIGHEQSQWYDDIEGQCSVIKEFESTDNQNDLFEKVVREELINIKQKLIATDKKEEPRKEVGIKSSPMKKGHASSMSNISMMVLGGFIAAAGIAAVAIAFTVLNAATFGITGLLVAGIGSGAVLAGVGLFASGAYKNMSKNSDISLDHSQNMGTT